MKIVDFSIRRPVTVTMIFVALTVFGIVSYDKLALNLLPEISYPALTIRTYYDGAAPAEIENLISRPIENAVSVVNNVIRVSSTSRPDVSDVILEFSWKTNMDFAALEVREKLDLVQLPLVAEKPILLRYDPSTDPIMRVSVSGSDHLAAIRYICEEFVRPDLESIGGVAAVRVSGGLEDEIYVELDEERLKTLDISIQEVTSRLSQENINLTAGTLKEGESKYLVRTLNEFQTVDEINDVIVAVRGQAHVRLKDIGRAYSGYKERKIITRINGQESVEVAVFKAADANTVSVARAVQQRLAELGEEYREKQNPLQFSVVFDQARFIKQSIDEVLQTAIIGGILAILILFVFLRSLKSTAIIGLAIPISIVTTFFLMYASNVSMNIMSLGGLALGIGMLVDNSIVVLESIFRYYQKGYAPAEAANLGASEVGQAVVASTMTTICVFVPIVFVEGIAGQLFADQALTVTFSLVASLVVAIILIPMLSSLGEGTRAVQEASEGRFWLARPYRRILSLALRNRLLAVSAAVLVFFSSAFLLARLGAELIPEISQGEFFVDFQLTPGVPLEQTSRTLATAESLIQDPANIAHFYTIVGSGNQTGLSAVEEREHIGQILVKLEPGILHEDEDRIIQDLRARLHEVPGVEYKFARPAFFSFKTPIEVVLQGYNLNALKAYAEQLTERLKIVPGLTDLKASTEGGNPELQIQFDRRRLAHFGLTINQAGALVRNKILGEVSSEFNDVDRQIDIRVRVTEKDRNSIANLRNLVLTNVVARPVLLSSVADVVVGEGPAEIRRIGPQRAALISGNIRERDLQSVVADIEAVLADYPLPSDFVVFVGGQSEEREVAFESMQLAILLAVFLVYLVMASQFESLVQPFVIMFAIPFAAVGVGVALFFTSQPINVVVLIGAVVLAGIVVNNSIVLIDFTNQLRNQGLSKFDAVLEAGTVRLRPILMTTSTTVLGLLPMALSWGEGAELRVPLAITIIGGLIASTLLTLVLVPVLYTAMVREKKP